MKSDSFVIDTNTLASAFLFNASVPKIAFDLAKTIGTIVGTRKTFIEFRDVFVRSKFDKYISLATRLAIITELEDLFIFFAITETISDCRDPKDNKFLELAVASNASCLISGDQDLLVLNPFRDIPILNATDFIEKFDV